MKKILIISFSNLNSDPRVLRQIKFFGKSFHIYTAGLAPSYHPFEKEFVDLKLLPSYNSNYEIKFHFGYPFLLRKFFSFFVKSIYFFILLPKKIKLSLFKNSSLGYETRYWDDVVLNAYHNLVELDFDLIISNDVSTLPLAIRLKETKKCKVYFDAHEYSPLEYDNDKNWLKNESPYITYLIKKYIFSTDFRSTIGLMVAEKYFELTGLVFDVVYNAPEKHSLSPTISNDSVIRCVHHGIAVPIRKIEIMIDAFKLLDSSFELNLYLMNNDNEYYEFLLQKIENCSNIFIHEPVPTEKLPLVLNQYDVMLIFIPPINFNYSCGLPNKFFEAIQARLMLLCGPFKEQKDIIEEFNLGIVSKGFCKDDIFNSLICLDKKQIIKFKTNSNLAADVLCADKIMNKLVMDVSQII